MKKFTMFSNYLFLLMAAAILGLTACGDDPILNTEIPPSASISSLETEINAGETITLSISGTEGDATMNLLTITEDGVTIDLDRISSADIASNPASLLGDNANAFAFTVEIVGPSIPGLYTYAANIGDDNGKTGSSTVDVTVLEEVATPPSIEYMGATNLTVTIDETPLIFNISATTGSSDLSTIAVYEDGQLINPASLRFNGEDFDTNPYSLVGDDLTGFDMADVRVEFENTGTYNLAFEVTDANGETASTEATIEVVDAGTPITSQFEAVLLSNRSGPATTLGGLDLDNGENVPGSSAAAEVVDLGIVDPVNDPTWIQKIEGANGAVLVAADPSSPELFNFANINSREAIIAAFESGIGGPLANQVQVGDVFIVNRDNNYYIMETVEVMVTNNNNEDFYRFDIKTSIQ